MKGRPRRLLLVDAGNTTCTLASARGGVIRRLGSLPTASFSAPAAALLIKRVTASGDGFDGAVLCSVVPKVDDAWRAVLRTCCPTPPLTITCRLDIGLSIRYPKPETIGADRLVNVAAASARFGTPVVAFDFGTALTCDVVDPRGAFVGGIIAPGMRVMTDYLHERTAKLPAIGWGRVSRMIGRSTRESMTIGACAGYAGLVGTLMTGLRRELGPRVRFCATGGDARRMASVLGAACPIVPNLTFEGMRLVYERNTVPRGDRHGG